MSKSSKGSAAELEVKKLLEDQKYVVEKVRNTIWHRGDFFGYFDLICKKKFKTRYIQVKYQGKNTDLDVKGFLKQIKTFAEDYSTPTDSYELWVKKAPRWVGSGKNKRYEKAKYIVHYINHDGAEWGVEEFYAGRRTREE